MTAESSTGHAASWQVHRAAAASITVCPWILMATLGSPSLTVQWLALLGGLVLTGIPHGALDHLHGRSMLASRFPTLWLPIFMLGYLLCAAAVAGVWLAFPVASLVAFLLLSAIHFGQGDAGRSAHPASVLLMGSTPILAPVLAHPAATGELFAALTGTDAVRAADLLAAGFWPTLLAWCGLAGLALPRLRSIQTVEVGLIAISGVALPPLLSFAVYFCVWHAPRHIIQEADAWLHLDGWRRIRSFYRAATPMTLLTFALAAGAYTAWPLGGGEDAALAGTVFIGLAALTVPHMLVHGIDWTARRPVPSSAIQES